MIQITPQMRIWLAVEPVDFRKGIDGLAALCRQQLKADPMGGALFVFSSKRRKSLRCLAFDGQGYWLCQKRLSEGRFRWWPQSGDQPTYGLDAHQLQLLLWNGNPLEVKTAPMWRRLTPTAA
jgi:transposase